MITSLFKPTLCPVQRISRKSAMYVRAANTLMTKALVAAPKMVPSNERSLFPRLNSLYFEWVKKLLIPRNFSIATVCLAGDDLDPLTRLDRIAAGGFTHVEIMSLDVDQVDAAEIAARCESLGLKVLAYQPFRDFEGIPAQLAEKSAQLRAALAVANTLNTDVLLMCATCDENASSDADLLVDHLRVAADEAAAYGVKIAYEALAWCKNIENLHQLVDFVVRVDRPNFGICLDSFHIFSKKSSLECISRVRDKIFLVQLCDAPLLDTEDYLYYSRNFRNLPMQGELDNLALLEELDKAGFKGPLSLETFMPAFKNADKQDVADDAFRSLLLVQLASEKILPPPPKIKGVLLDDDAVVSPSQLSSIDVVVDGKEDYARRVKLFHYHSNAITLLDGKKNWLQKMSTRLNVICKDGMELNRIVLYCNCVLGFRILRDDSSIFNEIGLPLVLTLGGEDGLRISLAVPEK